MSFQFRCPNNHLLQGEPFQAGQQCVCPECQTAFTIPQPVQNAVGSGGVQHDFDTFELAETQPNSQPAQTDAFGMPVQQPTGANPFDEPVEEKLVHIPCPQGHLLETPADMLGQTVLCPHCGDQFDLKETNSVEYKREKEASESKELRRKSKLWLNWAIVIGTVVGIFLVVLIIVAVKG